MRNGWRQRELFGALAYSATGCALHQPRRLAGQAGVGLVLYQASIAARTPNLMANSDYIDRLPFDGLTVNVTASWSVMQSGGRADDGGVDGSWPGPVARRLPAAAGP